MKLQTLAALRRRDIPARPLDAGRLNTLADQRLIRMRRPPANLGSDLKVRFLVKGGRSVQTRSLSGALHTRLGSPALRRDRDRLASTMTVKPLGRPLSDGTRWYTITTACPLGGLLEDVGYNRREIDELTADIAAIPGVVYAELDMPCENMVSPLQSNIPGCTAGRDAAPDNVDWAPDLVGFFDLPAGSPTGSGVTVGHIDTGYTDHAELNVPDAYDLTASTSTIGPGGGVDPMDGGSSHGTATGTVITSAAGSSATNDLGQPSDGITGLAPGATVVAVRGIADVVIVPFFTQADIAAAVHHCIDTGCEVVSMSFGGLLSPAVTDALEHAFDADIILCAAAGNCVRFVVQPAALSGVIACAGVGVDPADGSVHPWPGTSRGPSVDIAAPAENVWVGDWSSGQQQVRPGEGTSFAAPHVAAAAALWLEEHDGDPLLEEYAAAAIRLGEVFRFVVQGTANVPAGWDTDNLGAGVVNLPALLAAPLPEPSEVAAATNPAGDWFGDLIGTIGGAVTGLAVDVDDSIADPFDVVVDLDHLTVRDDGEFWGGSEPYLQTTFLTVDGTTCTLHADIALDALISGGEPLTVTTEPIGDSPVRTDLFGGHGNLPTVNIGPLELNDTGPVTVDIPSAVGRFTTTLQPIPISLRVSGGPFAVEMTITGLPGFVGVVALLGEEDFTPDNAVEAAHAVVAEGVASIVSDVLAEIDLSDLSVDPSAFIERSKQIQDDATAAAAEQMNLWELFWGGLVDPDDQLLPEPVFQFVNALQIGDSVRFQAGHASEHGDWVLVGEIRPG